MQQDSFCKMEYGKDEKGQDILLKEGKFQVMMEWEKPYMEACIDILNPVGDVLEIGFGLGYSAERIQKYKPKSHTIIEYHPDIAKKAREWARQYPHVTIVENTWQKGLEELGVFDSIFFDDYPLESEEQLAQMQEQSQVSQSLLQSGTELIHEVEQQIPFLYNLHYSNEDLTQFFEQISWTEPLQGKQTARFLIELLSRNQISKEQCNVFLKKLVLDQRLTEEERAALLGTAPKKQPFDFSGPNERVYQFLSQCLTSHMRNGSRFSCFLSSATSKFEDPKFFKEIILNPFLDFHEEEMHLEVPPYCDYFSGNKALVITITKRGLIT